MNSIRVLDCTLRDGGYVNQWEFGFYNINKIINNLVMSNIDIIECGFLTNKVSYSQENSRFDTIENVAKVIPKSRQGKLFVCLMNFGEYKLEDLPEYDGSSIDGIRVAFHKKDLEKALELCQGIKDKGYKLFLQPMVSLSYSDEEFLYLIRKSNEMKPYAFYIVDSFGVMKRKDLIRLYYMVEHNLDRDIYIGYHSHNNLQLSYSNAQSLVDIKTGRDLIIDSSVFGMGRGAGNLNTELFVEYLNDNCDGKYDTKPLLTIIDEVLNNIYLTNYWGYSLPHYVSAVHNCHPDYASYLDDKKTLTVENMHAILSLLPEDKKNNFDKSYIEQLYVNYLAADKIYEEHLAEFKSAIQGKRVLIIAPGKSIEDEKEKVISEGKREDTVCISVNFSYRHLGPDYIFLSNLRRYRELNPKYRYKTIVTSNVPAEGVYLQTKYAELLNDVEAVRDNAAMMLIKYLIKLGVKEIGLAGLDGYSHDAYRNFAAQGMAFITKDTVFDAMNKGMSIVLSKFARKISIKFITDPKYVTIEN